MNILYTIDELTKDYSRYLGVSILSLLEHNKDEDINIYILGTIEDSNKKEIIRIVENYGKRVFFSKGEIVPDNFKKILIVNPRWPFTVFYRLFFLNCFNITDRLLYIDCDTIINKNLKNFYDTNFEGNTFVGTIDLPISTYSREVKYGLKNYVNAGVLLINIDFYKNINMYDEILRVNEKYGIPDNNEEDYINLIFENKIMINNNLQCIVESLWEEYNFSDYLILHMIRKPNEGKLGFCKKEVEELFNNYLKRTKRKSYISYKKEMNVKEYIIFYYKYIVGFIISISMKIFGVKVSYYLDYIFYKLPIKFKI